MDSGHDFNIVHFTHCVGFLSNIVDIPYETALQMMARSRLTTNFLLCVQQTAVSKTKSFDITELLEEQRLKEASLVALHNNLHFGNIGMEDIANRHAYCPFLHILATNKMLIRKTRSSQFLTLIKELLMRNGADPDNMKELGISLCSEDLKAIECAKKTSKENAPAPSIATLQQEYNIRSYDVFAEMDDDTRKIYGNQTLIHAFQNQSALRVEGFDTENAIANIKRKICCTFEALEECSKSENFCENSIAQTRKFLVDGAASLVDANEMALKLFSIFTRSTDPFSFGSLLGSDLRRNLGCADVAYPKSPVSQGIRDQIADMYGKWSDIQGSFFEKRVKEQLTMTTALTHLNHMLASQFDIKLERIGKKKGKRGAKCDYVHILVRSKHFKDAGIHASNLECNKTVTGTILVEKTLPIIPNWNQLSGNPPEKSQLLSVKWVLDRNVVVPGFTFNHWPGRLSASQNEREYTGLQLNHLAVVKAPASARKSYEFKTDWTGIEKKRKRDHEDSTQGQQLLDQKRRNNEWDQKLEVIKLNALEREKKKKNVRDKKSQARKLRLKEINSSYMRFDSIKK
jgi:hypothetical protein